MNNYAGWYRSYTADLPFIMECNQLVNLCKEWSKSSVLTCLDHSSCCCRTWLIICNTVYVKNR